ncbi:unnamed protein product [Rotaria socialis]|uniref:Kinesin light chain n=1 Tax=Rotaria socialis TaxID=392032 RepID=A0A820CWA8_9BILA|nr:unnamed protein product [Rotaria socialis]CAF4229419.1 unnamed protein product [Rotaria socialis]
MGFFIRRLHRAIEQLYHKQQSTAIKTPFKLYRGQGLLEKHFETLKQAKGRLMSFNNFLSTSRNRDLSLKKITSPSAALNQGSVGVLFVMTIDPTLCASTSTSFADIKSDSQEKYQGDEILFSTHTIFRIDKIERITDDHTNTLWEVYLTFVGNNDNDLRTYTVQMQKELNSLAIGWSRLARIFIKLRKFEKLETLYEYVLKNTSSATDKENYCDQLGCMFEIMENYPKALSSYEKSSRILSHNHSPNHLNLAASYSNIGALYGKMNENKKMLASYEILLQVRKQSLPPNHPDLAASYRKIGTAYSKILDYTQALSAFQRTLGIREKTLSLSHPDLAASYHNMDMIYAKMQEYSKALSYFERVLSIWQKFLPSTDENVLQLKKILIV